MISESSQDYVQYETGAIMVVNCEYTTNIVHTMLREKSMNMTSGETDGPQTFHWEIFGD